MRIKQEHEDEIQRARMTAALNVVNARNLYENRVMRLALGAPASIRHRKDARPVRKQLCLRLTEKTNLLIAFARKGAHCSCGMSST